VLWCLPPAAISGAAAAGAAKGPVHYRLVKHFRQQVGRDGPRVMALLREWQPSWVTGGSVQGVVNVRLVQNVGFFAVCTVADLLVNLVVFIAREGVGEQP